MTVSDLEKYALEAEEEGKVINCWEYAPLTWLEDDQGTPERRKVNLYQDHHLWQNWIARVADLSQPNTLTSGKSPKELQAWNKISKKKARQEGKSSYIFYKMKYIEGQPLIDAGWNQVHTTVPWRGMRLAVHSWTNGRRFSFPQVILDTEQKRDALL